MNHCTQTFVGIVIRSPAKWYMKNLVNKEVISKACTQVLRNDCSSASIVDLEENSETIRYHLPVCNANLSRAELDGKCKLQMASRSERAENGGGCCYGKLKLP